jgi:hypothetical protein
MHWRCPDAQNMAQHAEHQASAGSMVFVHPTNEIQGLSGRPGRTSSAYSARE